MLSPQRKGGVSAAIRRFLADAERLGTPSVASQSWAELLALPGMRLPLSPTAFSETTFAN